MLLLHLLCCLGLRCGLQRNPAAAAAASDSMEWAVGAARIHAVQLAGAEVRLDQNDREDAVHDRDGCDEKGGERRCRWKGKSWEGLLPRKKETIL